MTKIAIVTSFMRPADAVSNDVLGMFEALARRGYDVRIYAERWTLPRPRVWPATEVGDFLRHSSDVLIYHHAIGWDLGVGLLQSVACRVAVRYHNVTPPEFFAGVSAWHEEMCRRGKEQINLLARAGYDLYLPASEFSSAELTAAGARASDCLVVPPFHHADRLRRVEPDFDALDAYADGRTNVLTVGRVAPNKGYAELIEAFAAYHHQHDRDSRLLLVGREEEAFAAYSARLRDLLEFLWLRDAVVFAGEVTDETLKALYLTARAFVTTSRHEGFCVPLVEAMALGVPVVAYASSAIPDTVGDAGLLWQERNPDFLAASLDLLARDESVSFALGRQGRRRYEQLFTNERIEGSFARAINRLL